MTVTLKDVVKNADYDELISAIQTNMKTLVDESMDYQTDLVMNQCFKNIKIIGAELKKRIKA